MRVVRGHEYYSRTNIMFVHLAWYLEELAPLWLSSRFRLQNMSLANLVSGNDSIVSNIYHVS